MRSIGVIDYGMGNLHSLAKALERVAPDQRVVVSYDAEEPSTRPAPLPTSSLN